jgi:hypothetical protein
MGEGEIANCEKPVKNYVGCIDRILKKLPKIEYN